MLSVWKTGLYTMDWVTGCTNTKANANIGTTFQIRFPDDYFLPPSLEYYIPNDLSIRDNAKGHLKTMSVEEREAWLKRYSSDTEHYISDFKDADVRFKSIGGVFTKLSNEDQTRLNSGEWLSMEEVFNMFPRKPGSRAARHSLIFRGSIWTVIDVEEEQEEVDIYYDLIDCVYSDTQTRERVCVITTEGSCKTKIGLCDNEPMMEYPTVSDDLEKRLHWFTPGILKSLIQKCIRMYPEEVAILNTKTNEDDIYPIDEVLLTSFLLLLKNPGSFVPDLRAFVKGPESAMKRLAVSIIEDSSVSVNEDSKYPEAVNALLFAALAARKDWRFSEDFIFKSCEWCIEALNDNYYEYDWHKLKGNRLNCENRMICNAITTLGSFESDINMIKSCCENEWSTKTMKNKRPKIMRIEHCFDHHCCTDIIYLLNIDHLDPKDAIGIIWDGASGFNPRKHDHELNPDVEAAQLRYWKIKTMHQEQYDVEGDSYEYSRILDESWITGMIGPIEHKMGSSNLTSFFHPDNISSVVTIRSASRAKDQKELTEEELEKSTEYVVQKMKKPFKLKEESINIDSEFIFKDDEFIMKDGIKWKEYCSSSFEVIHFSDMEEMNFDEIIDFISSSDVDGVVNEWQQHILNYLSELPVEVIYRISMYLRIVSDEIAPYKISRDGTGSYQTVNWTDLYLFRFLCFCSVVIPIAIKIKKDNSITIGFKITNIFIWNHLKKIVFDFIGETELYDWLDEVKSLYKQLKIKFTDEWSLLDIDKREMREHQQQAVDQIMSRIQFGKRGNIIWIPVGGGKTFIVINVLFRLMQRKALPKYIVYALPPGAYESVFNEFKQNSASIPILPSVYLDGTAVGKKKGSDRLREFHINFIKHDHMRSESIKEQLLEHASDIFLILDEFHLMMNVETQRTSIALEMSKISNNFIALTGTLVKDKDPKGIIEWISQVVEFKLTEKNYMVGVASLISNKISYGVEEIRTFIDVPIEEGDEYYSLVDSKLGGTAEQTKFREAVNRCYSITRDAIFEIAIQVLEEEPNVFVVALNKEMQQTLAAAFEEVGKKVFCITSQNSIVMTPGTHEDIQVVITTMQHAAGYTLTAIKTMVQGVYFSNQATRTQMIGRLIRMGQPSPNVDIITVHCGILSYTLKHYEDTRSLEKALGDLAKDI